MSRIDEPIDILDLVDYQDGAVVSQTLAKAAAGTVTVFAFDAGEGLSEHTAPFDALLLAVDGRGSVRLGEQEHTMIAGEILRLPAGVPHAVQAIERFKMLLVMIRDAEPSPGAP